MHRTLLTFSLTNSNRTCQFFNDRRIIHRPSQALRVDRGKGDNPIFVDTKIGTVPIMRLSPVDNRGL
jgi:hypothetical protein